MQKNKRNIIIVSHKVVHQPDDDLVIYLNNKNYANVLHIFHSFSNATDRKSKYIWYKKGIKFKEFSTLDFKFLPETSIYLKEAFYTFKWILESKIKWNIFLGLDGLCIFFGNILRTLNYVDKTFFWAIDFVPKDRFNGGIKNKIYNWINKKSYLGADEMWDLSPRMQEGRKVFFGILPSNYKKHRLVPYGLWIDRINPLSYSECDKTKLVFLGNLSKYQGLQLIINILPKLMKIVPQIRLSIFGEGEYTPIIKKLAKKLKVMDYCEFMGRIEDNKKLEKEISKGVIALAPYLIEIDYISRYGDLGKIKTYLACGVPVLTTNVPWNAKEIEKNKCGIIIEENEDDILKKILFLLNKKNNENFRKNALNYAKNFNFNNIFNETGL